MVKLTQAEKVALGVALIDQEIKFEEYRKDTNNKKRKKFWNTRVKRIASIRKKLDAI